MFAVYAARLDASDPVAGLELGEQPEPEERDGWTTIAVRAASLNHHDLWSLRGVGLKKENLPMILGCDAAGIDEDGNEVVVHAVISDPDWLGDETLDPRRSLLSERYQGTFAERGGDLGALAARFEARRGVGFIGRHHRRRSAGRAAADLLPPAVGGRFDDGHPRGARAADPPVRGARRAAGDRQGAAAVGRPR